MNQLTPYHTSPFDAIRQIDENGQEYWSARDMQNPFGYVRWENYKETIEKAMISCEKSGHNPDDHFRGVTKMVSIGSGTQREIDDVHLTRYGSYLAAMNGDVRKEEIANAQSYFAVKTREAELAQSSQQDQIARMENMIENLQKEIRDIKQLVSPPKRIKATRGQRKKKPYQPSTPMLPNPHLSRSEVEKRIIAALQKDPGMTMNKLRLKYTWAEAYSQYYGMCIFLDYAESLVAQGKLRREIVNSAHHYYAK